MDELVDASKYSPRVVERFEAPRHAGIPESANHAGKATSAARGTRVVLHLRVTDGRVEAAGFELLGCPHALAAADLVCEDLAGKLLAALGDYEAGFLAEALSLPAEKLDLKILLEDVVRHAARQEEN